MCLVLVGKDSVDLSVSGLLKVRRVVIQVSNTLLEGLEGNENFSFVLDAVGVLILSPDRVVLVELVDLSVEVSTWQWVLIGMLVVWSVVSWVLIVVVVIVWVLVVIMSWRERRSGRSRACRDEHGVIRVQLVDWLELVLLTLGLGLGLSL